MKCLNLIGQCEGSKSLGATVCGFYMLTPPPRVEGTFATTVLFMNTVKQCCYKQSIVDKKHVATDRDHLQSWMLNSAHRLVQLAGL